MWRAASVRIHTATQESGRIAPTMRVFVGTPKTLIRRTLLLRDTVQVLEGSQEYLAVGNCQAGIRGGTVG